MHLFVYISDYEGRLSEINSVLADIDATARLHNKVLDVTGVLFYQNGSFLEVLEGEKSTLKMLVKKISRDKRHRHITPLVNQRIEQRSFSDWKIDSLGFESHVQLDRKQLREIGDALTANHAFKTETLVQFYKNIM